jgi:hypothetical protein
VFEKIAQNVTQPIFCPNYYIAFSVEKSCPKICTASLISNKLPKENNSPAGESSLNLVTLVSAEVAKVLSLFPRFQFTLPSQDFDAGGGGHSLSLDDQQLKDGIRMVRGFGTVLQLQRAALQ